MDREQTTTSGIRKRNVQLTVAVTGNLNKATHIDQFMAAYTSSIYPHSLLNSWNHERGNN